MNDQNEPIDLQKRRLARELEAELGGLFGIELPDIEEAIGRLYDDFASGSYDEFKRMRRLPEPLQRVIQNLESVYAIALLLHEEELYHHAEESQDQPPVVDAPLQLQHVIELVENYLERLKRLADAPDES